jgi:hypothetical protein
MVDLYEGQDPQALARSLGVSPSELEAGRQVAIRKLSGQRIVSPSGGSAVAYTYFANTPEFLRGRQEVLGRGAGAGASQMRGQPTEEKTQSTPPQTIAPPPRTTTKPKVDRGGIVGFGEDFVGGAKSFISQATTPFREVAGEFFSREGAGGFISEETSGRISEFGEKGQEFFGGLGEATEDFFLPSAAARRHVSEVEALRTGEEFGALSGEIEAFNVEFGGRTLPPEEFEEAVVRQRQIEGEIFGFERTRQSRETRQQKEFERLEFGDPIGSFIGGAARGVIRSPFELASFGVGLATSPTKEFTETTSGFGAIPAQFKLAPYSTSGEIVGSFAGQSAILSGFGAGLRGFKTTFKEVKPTRQDLGFLEMGKRRTAFSKTFAEDPYVFKKGEIIGKKMDVFPSDLTGLKQFQRGQRLEVAKESFLGKLDTERALGQYLEATKPTKIQKLALKRLRQAESGFKPLEFSIDISKLRNQFNRFRSGADILKLGKDQRFRIKPSKEKLPYEPIKFDIDLSSLRNQMARFKSGADIVAINKELQANIRPFGVRLRKKPRGKPLKVSQPKPISFEFKPENLDQVVKTSGKQQQILLKKPELKQIQKPKVFQVISEKQAKQLRKQAKQQQKQFQAQKQLELQPLQQKQVLLFRQGQQQLLLAPPRTRQRYRVRQQQIFGQLQGFKQLEKSLQNFGQPTLQLPRLREGVLEKPKGRLKPRLKFKETPLKMFIPPKFELGELGAGMRASRFFKESPTLFSALGKEFGFKAPRKRTKREQKFGVPLESPLKRTKLPVTFLGKTKKIKFKKPKGFYI